VCDQDASKPSVSFSSRICSFAASSSESTSSFHRRKVTAEDACWLQGTPFTDTWLVMFRRQTNFGCFAPCERGRAVKTIPMPDVTPAVVGSTAV
jgi:hypothetical protein